MTIKILADASLPLLLEAFPAPFQITRYSDSADIPQHLPEQAILIVRSTCAVNQNLLHHHQPRIVATASSGSEHLDHSFLSQKKITVLDAKGSNALAVSDYVLSSLAYLKTHQLLSGNRIGIIGVGAVGSLVSQRLQALDFELVLHDPLRASQDPSFKSAPKEALFNCQILCVHANYHEVQPYPTKHFINQAFLKLLQPDTVIINAARGGIVDESALIQQIHDKRNARFIYCTDVYQHEPDINPEIVALASLCTPHIAGHSIEAKNRAVTLLSEKIHDYYKLPYPDFIKNRAVIKPAHLIKESWVHQMLSHYDPSIETRLLKASHASNLKTCFLELRRQHTVRHDLSN